MPFSFADLTFQELDALPRQTTVFLFAVGAAEDHGPHLPMGLKSEKSKALSAWIADRLMTKDNSFTCYLMPACSVAIDASVSNFGSFVRPHVFRDYFIDQIESLRKLGFSNFLIVSSSLGPRSLVALDEVCQKYAKSRWGVFRAKAKVISLAGSLHEYSVAMDSPMIANPVEHAGAQDTSTALLLFPEKVRPSWKELPEIPRQPSGISRTIQYWQGKTAGYWGDPKLATSEMGAREFEEIWSGKIDLILQFLKEGKGLSYFRTPYRYFPLNWTFFPAYIMAATFSVLMIFWVIWGLKGVFNDF